MRSAIVSVLLGLGPCLGCVRSMEQREEARVQKYSRQGIKLLDGVEREGYRGGEWPQSANRIVFQLAPYVVDEMVTRALRPGDNHCRHLMVSLLEQTRTAGGTFGIGRTVGRRLGEVSDKEGKRIAIILHRRFPSEEGYRLALSLLEDPDPEVRMWAVGSLCSEHPWFGIQAAEEIAKRLHDEVRDVAKVTAGEMSSLRHPHVAALLRDHAERIEDPLVKRVALQSSKSIDDALKWLGLPDWARSQEEAATDRKMEERSGEQPKGAATARPANPEGLKISGMPAANEH